MNKILRNFLYIVVAALGSALLGGAFAAAISLLSPEFVDGLFARNADGLVRYAAAAGMVWGLFIGAGAMAFSIFAYALTNMFNSRKHNETRWN
jgi:hypothetical protein